VDVEVPFRFWRFPTGGGGKAMVATALGIYLLLASSSWGSYQTMRGIDLSPIGFVRQQDQ
jgi:hypothetical protein